MGWKGPCQHLALPSAGCGPTDHLTLLYTRLPHRCFMWKTRRHCGGEPGCRGSCPSLAHMHLGPDALGTPPHGAAGGSWAHRPQTEHLGLRLRPMRGVRGGGGAGGSGGVEMCRRPGSQQAEPSLVLGTPLWPSPASLAQPGLLGVGPGRLLRPLSGPAVIGRGDVCGNVATTSRHAEAPALLSSSSSSLLADEPESSCPAGTDSSPTRSDLRPARSCFCRWRDRGSDRPRCPGLVVDRQGTQAVCLEPSPLDADH